VRLYKRGNVWHVDYADAEGNRVRESTKIKDRREAEEFGRRREQAARDPDRATREAETLKSAFQRLVDDRQAKARVGKGSIKTAKFYVQKSGHWVRIFGADYPLLKLSAKNVDDYVIQRLGEGAMQATVAKEMVTLRAAMRLAIRAKAYDGNPLAILPVGFSPEYVPRSRWLPPEELSALLGKLVPDRAARVAFMVAVGAELGATDRARREDIGREFVLVRGTKRASRWRKVPVVTKEQRSLLAYVQEHAEGTNGLLFRPWSTGSIIRDIKGACRRAGIEPCTPNDLRRTFAQWLRQGGVPIELLAPMMGHTTTKMVQMVYAKLNEKALAARVRAALGCADFVPEGSTINGSIGNSGTQNQQDSLGISAPGPTRTGDLRIRSPSFQWSKPATAGENRHDHDADCALDVPKAAVRKGGSRP